MKPEHNPRSGFGGAHRASVLGAVAALLILDAAIAGAGAGARRGESPNSEYPAERYERQSAPSLRPNEQVEMTETAHKADPHAHHQHMLMSKAYSRSEHDYQLPDSALIDMDGRSASLRAEINTGQPVMLNFIFTTCTTICPVLSATFSQVQQELGDSRDHVRMISITIDPEHDTPARLHAYADRFHAGANWQFLTGDPDDIVAIQKAFDAYHGSKVNHVPLTFLRASVGAPWVRIEGLASASDVIREYEKLVSD